MVSYQALPETCILLESRLAFAPLPDHNLTKALSVNPSIILISFPSNDVAVGFSNEEAIANFHWFEHIAHLRGVRVIFLSLQPRNSTVEVRRQLGELNRKMLAKFEPCWIDVYHLLSDEEGNILPGMILMEFT